MIQILFFFCLAFLYPCVNAKTPTASQIPPELRQFLPNINHCDRALKEFQPAPVSVLTPEESAAEYLQFLNLSHPLAENYLFKKTTSSGALHRDLKLLALIWGDQRSFDMREAEGGPSPFQEFLETLRWWSFRDRERRTDLVSKLTDTIADLQWSFSDSSNDKTIYLENFEIRDAFKTGRNFIWLSTFPRHWEGDNSSHLSADLHQRIYELRLRLKDDSEMREHLQGSLYAALPEIMAPLNTYLIEYRKFVLKQPNSTKALVERIKRKTTLRGNNFINAYQKRRAERTRQ